MEKIKQRIRSDEFRLFIISFSVLFLELALIRYVPSQARYVSYFSNIILLASFVGIGFGTLLYKRIRFPLSLFPFLLAIFYIVLSSISYDLVVASDEVVYFNVGFTKFSSDPIFLLPILFFACALIMAIPAASLGEYFSRIPNLKAYAINTAGSIIGIALFTALSFFGAGPAIWFSIVTVLSIIASDRLPFIAVSIAYGIIILFFFASQSYGILSHNASPSGYEKLKTVWSPYYKISLYAHKAERENIYFLNVNNIGHQTFQDPDSSYSDFFYKYPYVSMPERKFEDVLVIGAGGGNDVAKAIRQDANKITAVEIDPSIVDLGNQYHPSKPYASDNVKVVVDDGRSFLVNDSNKYDLVIFALTDSLTLSSAASSLRLESYLFTREAFEDVRRRLDDDGVVVLYNYYRSGWVVDKLQALMDETFGKQTVVYEESTSLGPAAVLINGNADFLAMPRQPTDAKVKVPVDDWPFLYLKNPGIPNLYVSYLSVILIMVLLAFLFIKRSGSIKFDMPLFFMGGAFMLLETKNVVQFSLLFGSTWLTNSFVFAGLLVLVLLAIFLAKKYPNAPIKFLFAGLLVLLAITYIIPQRELLNLSFVPRLLGAIIINFSPVFLANFIYALMFAKSEIAPMAYGSNILGAFIGGVMEYSSLVFGYKYLLIFVAIFYVMAFGASLRKLTVRL